MKINTIVSLCFNLDEVSEEFFHTYERGFNALDCEFQDHVPVRNLEQTFVLALYRELGVKDYKHITHIQSIF